MISTADSCFYDLEEIEEADLFANGGLKGKVSHLTYMSVMSRYYQH